MAIIRRKYIVNYQQLTDGLAFVPSGHAGEPGRSGSQAKDVVAAVISHALSAFQKTGTGSFVKCTHKSVDTVYPHRIFVPTMPNDAMLKIRVSAVELANWNRAAKDTGRNLSEWVRLQCNGGAQHKYSANAGSTGLAAEASVPLPRATETAPRSLPPKNACIHGTAKGFNCWQCGGTAKV